VLKNVDASTSRSTSWTSWPENTQQAGDAPHRPNKVERRFTFGDISRMFGARGNYFKPSA
jgi:hypothetical protein